MVIGLCTLPGLQPVQQAGIGRNKALGEHQAQAGSQAMQVAGLSTGWTQTQAVAVELMPPYGVGPSSLREAWLLLSDSAATAEREMGRQHLCSRPYCRGHLASDELSWQQKIIFSMI